VFNVVGEVLPAAQVERVLRDYYSGRLGDADLEERIMEGVDEGRFRAICQTALEGLATKKLNLEMLVERRAQAQERRVVPETIARFLGEAAGHAAMELKAVKSLPHTFDPSRTPPVLQRYERDPDWKLPAVVSRYPRLSTDRAIAEEHHLEWVTPGHPLFESIRRHVLHVAQEPFKRGACFYSLQHEAPARIDFYRARVVDGLGNVVHERLLAVEVCDGGTLRLREPTALGDFAPATTPSNLPAVATLPEATSWLHENGLRPFLEEVRSERLVEVVRVAEHVELSLTELLQKADDEIGRGATEVEKGVQGSEGRVAQAEARHAELLARRDRRRRDLEQQRSLTLQGVERMASVLVLPHPER
ncbi:MAG: helicase, partial [Chloroflexota bacterium]